MTSNLYILDEKGNPIVESDIYLWSNWFENADLRRVAKDTIGDSDVSTVFLGVDHNFNKRGPPILWETMVFGGKLDREQDRCSGSKEQAEAMHARMVKRVKDEQ